MIQSDALSRRPDFALDEDHDNEDVTLLPDKLFINLIDMDLQKRIASSPDLDTIAADAVKTLLEQGPTSVRNDLSDWTTELLENNNVLFYKGRNYIPKDKELRMEITEKYHDSPTAGHPGELETFNAIKEHYWWPGM